MKMKQVLVSIFVLQISIGYIHAQESINKKDDSAKVLHFEEMIYPSLAQSTTHEASGVVVIKANLDGHGNVGSAEALAGNDVLVPDSISNVKKWHFEPNSPHEVIIVYNFRRLAGECKTSSSFFTFAPPNLVNVIGCWPSDNRNVNSVEQKHETMSQIADDDMQIRDYEEIRYPPIAWASSTSGVVVVDTKLDDNGTVLQATAISGPKMLMSGAIENAKKWSFQPNRQHHAVIVYYFKMPCQTSKYNSDEQRLFVLQKPNFVVIEAPPMYAQP